MRAAALALVASRAVAQNWGSSGSWELVLPSPNSANAIPQCAPRRRGRRARATLRHPSLVLSPPPPPRPITAYQHAAFMPGYFIVAGNDVRTAAQRRARPHSCSRPPPPPPTPPLSPQTGPVATPPGQPDLYMFNVATNQWLFVRLPRASAAAPRRRRLTPPPLLSRARAQPFNYIPNTAPVVAPFLFTIGGIAAVIDETVPSTIYAIDTTAGLTAGQGAWSTVTTTTPPPLGRVAQRFLSWGSVLYMFGGYNQNTFSMANDLWALDATPVVASTMVPPPNPMPSAGWMQVTTTSAANGIITGDDYPPPRVGYTWTGFSIGATLMGGISNSDANGQYDVTLCWSTLPNYVPPATCRWHQHVYIFLPGYGTLTPASIDPKTGLMIGGTPTLAWKRLALTGDNGVPAGRAEHSAGSMGDQLYIYGGYTQQGLSSEMWTYNLVSESWTLVPATTPNPSQNLVPGSGTVRIGRGFTTGTTVGRHFYVWQQSFSGAANGQPQQNTGSLWRWTADNVPAGGGGGGGAAPVSNAIAIGHTWGIVIGILIGLGNLYYLVQLAAHAGVGCALPSISLPSFGGGAAKGPGGYYASSASAAAVANGGYSAPAEL